mgnify:FL=1
MIFKTGRYSGYLRPISYVIDLFIIHILASQFFDKNFEYLNYIIFVSFAWIVLSIKSNFYEIYRFTHVAKIMSLLGKQGIVFFLIVFAFFGYYKEVDTQALSIVKYIFLVMLCVTLVKFAVFFLLKKYRKFLGGNIRNVVVLGLNQKTDQLRKFFLDSPEYGYRLKRTFDISGDEKVSLDECFDFILENKIDEIYSSVGEIENKDLVKLIDFADNN